MLSSNFLFLESLISQSSEAMYLDLLQLKERLRRPAWDNNHVREGFNPFPLCLFSLDAVMVLGNGI